MTQRNLTAPSSGRAQRVAELHRLCAEDYAKGQAQRATPRLSPSYAAAPVAAHSHVAEPSDLDVAIRVAQQLLDSDQILSLREALRLLLRALGAEPTTRRCPAAHPEDLTPCTGPVVVTVIDDHNATADACELHAVRLLASIIGGRPVAKPDAPEGIALRIAHEASRTRSFAWREVGK